MGLLDDAIREHLDLKRRRGGDPAEIARFEQEALGPVRREPEPAEPVADDAHQAPVHREPAHHDEHSHAPHATEAQVELAEVHEPVPPEPQAEPAALEPAPDPRHTEIVLQPTTEFRIEDLHAAEDAAARTPAHGTDADEDVLEETPDFLQETPEHDRLWFEQRPPRDFDFDG